MDSSSSGLVKFDINTQESFGPPPVSMETTPSMTNSTMTNSTSMTNSTMTNSTSMTNSTMTNSTSMTNSTMTNSTSMTNSTMTNSTSMTNSTMNNGTMNNAIPEFPLSSLMIMAIVVGLTILFVRMHPSLSNIRL